jgi:hypothetical protein
MYQTTYHRPSSVDEAAALFAKGSESKYLAGGHTLLPVMKQRLASPSDVIDLGRIKELVGIEVSADALTIKAATTYFDIMQSADAKKAIAAIVHLTSVLGDPQVRYRGTIGGSIANNDPAADFPENAPSGLALRADRRVRGQDQIGRRPRGGHRRIAKRRHAGAGDRGGVEGQLVAGRTGQRQDFRGRAADRYPRLVHLPRQSDQCDGAARGR